MTTVFNYFTPESCISDCINKGVLYGVEYEIEDINKIKDTLNVKKFNIVDDFSLRNNGKEFISVPSTFKESMELFTHLHENLILGSDPYSPRTSIHVHCNVLSFSMEQLHNLILLYAYLEPAFFSYVGAKRKHNIHCVPLNWTLLPKYYPSGTASLVDAWSKYTAFNLLPVRKQGTVEFRHMYGTGDYFTFYGWLEMIDLFMSFVKNLPDDGLEKLITKNSWQDIAAQVWPGRFFHPPQDEIDQSVIDVKLAFV